MHKKALMWDKKTEMCLWIDLHA